MRTKLKPTVYKTCVPNHHFLLAPIISSLRCRGVGIRAGGGRPWAGKGTAHMGQEPGHTRSEVLEVFGSLADLSSCNEQSDHNMQQVMM